LRTKVRITATFGCAGSSQSVATIGMPARSSRSRAASLRTMTMNVCPAPERARTTSRPIVPVAPVTRIIKSSCSLRRTTSFKTATNSRRAGSCLRNSEQTERVSIWSLHLAASPVILWSSPRNAIWFPEERGSRRGCPPAPPPPLGPRGSAPSPRCRQQALAADTSPTG
jgi:hypothetical protein